MIFRQLFEPASSTYTYLLADAVTRRAVLIDPVVEEVETYAKLLADLKLTLEYTLETHVHADHVTAGAALRSRFGSRTVVHKDGGAACADVPVQHGDHVRVGAIDLEVLADDAGAAIALRQGEDELRASFRARGTELRSVRVQTRRREPETNQED